MEYKGEVTYAINYDFSLFYEPEECQYHPWPDNYWTSERCPPETTSVDVGYGYDGYPDVCICQWVNEYGWELTYDLEGNCDWTFNPITSVLA